MYGLPTNKERHMKRATGTKPQGHVLLCAGSVR